MLIKDRIRLIMKARNLSAAQFAQTIDVKPANLSHILSGRNKPSLDFLQKVIENYPNVNAAWLITGETRVGEEMPVKNEAAKESTSKQIDDSINLHDKDLEKIVFFYKDGSFESYIPKQ